MEPSRRVRVGLALHALGGAFLFVRDEKGLTAMAFVVAVGSAFRAAGIVQRACAVATAIIAPALCATLSHRTLADFGHVFVLLVLAVPACIDAAGTSFREGRTRWLWLRALLLLLAVVVTLGMWPAPKASALLPVLLVSHVLLRVSTAPTADTTLTLRTLLVMIAATLASIGLGVVSDLRFRRLSFDELPDTSFGGQLLTDVASLVPQAPFAAIALGIAFLAASLRIAPRAGLDGAVCAASALALMFPVDVHVWWDRTVLIPIAACLVATSMATRHLALRAFAAATILLSLAAAHRGATMELIACAVTSTAFVALAAAVATMRRNVSPAFRDAVVFVDPAYARLGALLHMAALALTVFEPTASLAALVPAVVFATRPLARFGTLALVTLAWATSPTLASFAGLHGDAAVAVHAWAPWIMLALLEAARSRGQPMFVARLGVTVGALLFAIAAFNDGALLVAGLLPGAVVVQAVLERAVGTVRPVPRLEPLAVVVAVPLLAGLAVFEFVMRWLVSKDGLYPYWELHPITLFLVDGIPALACVWLVAQAGIRRALPFVAPGGAMLAAAGVAWFAHNEHLEHALAAVAVAMFCGGAVTRPPLARIAGVWCGVVAAMVFTLRTSLPRPDVIAEVGYPLWVVLWFGALVAALVLSDAMRAAPLIAAPLAAARSTSLR
jgi:hypothetical protein